MSDRNIEIVQSLYAAFGAGDVKSIIKAAAAKVTWEIVGRVSDFPVFGRRSGLEGIAEFFEAFHAAEEVQFFQPKIFHALGDKVLVEGHVVSTLKGSGKQIDSDWLHIFTIKNGKLVGFKEFYDTAQYVV